MFFHKDLCYLFLSSLLVVRTLNPPKTKKLTRMFSLNLNLNRLLLSCSTKGPGSSDTFIHFSRGSVESVSQLLSPDQLQSLLCTCKYSTKCIKLWFDSDSYPKFLCQGQTESFSKFVLDPP